MMAAEFQFQVNEDQITLIEEHPQEFVDLEGKIFNLLELALARPSQRQDVKGIDHGIAQRIALVAMLQYRSRKGKAFFETESLGHAAGNQISNDHFHRNDLEPAHE